MKLRKYLSLFLALVLAISLLAGCGASAGSTSDYDTASMEEMESQSLNGSSMNTTLPENRKMIRTVYIDAQTKDMDTLLSGIEQQLAALGGYLEAREVYSGSGSNSQWRSAYLTLRIPAENTDTFLNRMEEASNITSINENLDDITTEYVDTESRITALKTEQERLLALMEQAEDLTDLLEIEERLTDVTYELENYSSQLRLYDNQVNYSTLYVNLYQVTELTTPEDEMTVWQRIASGFTSTLKGLGEALVDIFVWLIVNSPILLVIAIPVVLVIVLIRIHNKKKAAKKANNTPPADEQAQ